VETLQDLHGTLYALARSPCAPVARRAAAVLRSVLAEVPVGKLAEIQDRARGSGMLLWHMNAALTARTPPSQGASLLSMWSEY
jgi:hypothetical protein